MKICKDCKQELPESEFYKSPTTSDGLYGCCKSCFKAKRIQRYRTTIQQQDDRISAHYIARHKAKREYERLCEEALRKFEGRPLVEPLSFSGTAYLFLRPRTESRNWKAA